MSNAPRWFRELRIFLEGRQMHRARLGAAAGLAVGLIAAALLLHRVPLLSRIEGTLVDWRFALFARPERASDDVVVLEIDDDFARWCQTYGIAYPLTREEWAKIISHVAEAKPRAIVLDVGFTDLKETALLPPGHRFDAPETGGNRQLGEAFAAAGNVAFGIFEQGREGGDPAKIASATNRSVETETFLPGRVPPVDASARLPVYPPDQPGQIPWLYFPEPNVLAGARAVGLVNVTAVTDEDGEIRRFAPVLVVGTSALPSLPVAALAVAAAKPGSFDPWGSEWPPAATPPDPLPRLRFDGATARIAGATIPVDADGRAWLHWRGAWERDPALGAHIQSLAKVESALAVAESGSDSAAIAEAEKFRKSLAGKIVLLGNTLQGEAADTVRTPSGVQPGVFVWATALDTMLTGDVLRSAPRWLDVLLALLVPTLTGAAVLGAPPRKSSSPGQSAMLATLIAPGLVVLAAHVGGALLAFRGGWVVNMFHTELGSGLALLGAATSGWVLYRREAEAESRRKEHMLGLLTRTFGDEVAADLIQRSAGGELKLGGEKRTLTLYFSDIAGFTSISEKLPPEELVGILNEYLTRVTELFIHKHGAYVDKYIGDAVMASWGAPVPREDGPVRACLAALDAIEAMDAFSAELVKRGMSPLRTRVGINTGPAVAAWIGHPDHIAFTSLGDTVNLASRLEGANKHYGTIAMIGPQTYEEAKHAILARELDLVKVKGKKIPVRVYELMGRAEEPLETKRAIKARYEAALAKFRARDFAVAREEFLALATEFADPPAKVMADACEEYLRAPPPPDWDGSNELHEK